MRRLAPLAFVGALGCADELSSARVGSDAFLPKPFATGQLVELLTRLLGLTWRAAAAIRLREQPPQALRAAIELTLRVHALGSLWVAAFALLRDRF